jgi:DNA (cytosine-5)-methyltransferase 1
MKVLDLFSGIGGFSLGLERAGMETAAFCEIDPFCREVLKKHWPDVPIYEDVRKLKGGEIAADIICGGYPCQPFSVAGKRQGERDDRHLWPEVARLLSEVKPRWFIGENVAGHISMGLDEVLFDLEGQGYDAQTFVIPACAVDAKHRRDRVWIVGYSEHNGSLAAAKQGISCEAGNDNKKGKDEASKSKGASGSRGSKNVADTECERLEGEARTKCKSKKQQSSHGSGGGGENSWKAEPAVGRVANGIPRRVDRLRSLGNAVVPQIPEMIGRAIMEIEGLARV